MFNPKETADNLKKSGAFVPGIRPGEQTARYIEQIIMRLTLAGAIYVTLVCLLPEFLIVKWNVPFYFGGTSLLIIVVVTMDFMAQVQAYIMSHQYESLLKKANFKGGRVPGCVRANGEGRNDPDAGGDRGNPAERDLPGEAGKRARGAGTHLREDAHALHPHPAGRQGDGGADALRFDARRGSCSARSECSKEGAREMKVQASVKKICRNCKIIRRKRVVRVICTDPRHKQRQG